MSVPKAFALQRAILDAGVKAALFSQDVADSALGALESPLQPVLAWLRDKQGFSRNDMDKLLEAFWAENAERRGEHHRFVEEVVVGEMLLSAESLDLEQLGEAYNEFSERVRTGTPVRLLSVLADAGAIDESQAREVLEQAREKWSFCRFCLSAFEGQEAGAACGLCDRPLTSIARAYNIVSLSTLGDDTGAESVAYGSGDEEAVEPPSVGESLGGIKLLERVDGSGRGYLYRGERAGDGAVRAVKVWTGGRGLSKADLQRFEQAGLNMARVDHPGVLKIFEAGEERGCTYVVAEWIEGRSLRQVIEEDGPLDDRRCAELLLALSEAIGTAHDEGLQHKNINPSCILLPDSGGVKIGDFGVCKDYGVSLETVQGPLIGSPDYLAPEQCQGERSDVRTDVFSLGAVMYYALCGRPPFESTTAIATLVKRLTQAPDSLSKVAPGVHKDVRAVVERMMRREPDGRFQKLSEVAEWVSNHLEGRKPGKFAAMVRSYGPVASACAGVVLLLAALVYVILSQPTNPEVIARIEHAQELARQGEMTKASTEFSALERELGESVVELAPAVDAFHATVLAYAKGHAENNDFAPALAGLESAAQVGVRAKSYGEVTGLRQQLSRAFVAYKADAERAWGDLRARLTSLEADDKREQLRAFVATYPRSGVDELAGLELRSLEHSGQRQSVEEELQAALVAEDFKLASERMLTLRQLVSNDNDERIEAFDKRLKLLARMHGFREVLADPSASIEKVDETLRRFRQLSEDYPGDPGVRRAFYRASYGILKGRAEKAEAADDLKHALDYWRKAVEAAELAGLAAGDDRLHLEEVVERLARQAARERRQQQLIKDGDALAMRGEFEQALVKYVEAKTLRGGRVVGDDLELKIKRVEAQIGSQREDRAFADLTRLLKSKQSLPSKILACGGYLEKFPTGVHTAKVRRKRDELLDQAREAGVQVTAHTLEKTGIRGLYRNPTDGSHMVRIPIGSFVCGTTEAQAKALAKRWGVSAGFFAKERPARKVTLKSYYIDVNEVTNLQYAQFLNGLNASANPHRFCEKSEPASKRNAGAKAHRPEYWDNPEWNRPELPVVGIDFWDAYAYATWAGKRLPSEAEWEKAARGPLAFTYPWGHAELLGSSNSAEVWFGRAFPSMKVWQKDYEQTKPWAQRGMSMSASVFREDKALVGCFGMAGNVSEWCEDWYMADAYAKLGNDNPLCRDAKSKTKVVRGGSFMHPLFLQRATARFSSSPGTRRVDRGFRCARDGE